MRREAMKPVPPVTRADRMRRRLPAMETSVYFNPDCSNCRTAQALLAGRGVDADPAG